MKKRKCIKWIILSLVSIILSIFVTFFIVNYNKYSKIIYLENVQKDKVYFATNILLSDSGNKFKTTNSFIKLNGSLKNDNVENVEMSLIEKSKEADFLETYELSKTTGEIAYTGAVANWDFLISRSSGDQNVPDEVKVRDYLLLDRYGSITTDYSYYSKLKKNSSKQININELFKDKSEISNNLELVLIVHYKNHTTSNPEYLQIYPLINKL